jgi:glutamate dehydrogenase/leucine dehydrogenase
MKLQRILCVVFAQVALNSHNAAGFQPLMKSPRPLFRHPLRVSTENFDVQSHQYEKEGSKTVVFEVPVKQEGVKMFIANDGDLQTDRPGNGGMRLMSYESQEAAIEDAVRLAEGMTRKHAMYNTGFSGAKLVVHHGDIHLDDVDREGLMHDCAAALESLDGSIYTGCDINTNDEDMERLISHTPYVLAGIGSTVVSSFWVTGMG